MDCRIADCTRPVTNKSEQLCSSHNHRLRRHGDPLAGGAFRQINAGTCPFDGCTRTARKGGLCTAHYHQRRRGEELRPLRPENQPACNVAACPSPHNAKGYCLKHYRRWKKHGDPEVGGINTEGRYVDANDGYVRVKVRRNGRLVWMMEHRFLMEQSLGRHLTRVENVHHKNGIRDDNRMSNLELWTTKQPRGQRIEDKVAYAVELLSLYAPDLLAAERATLAG